MGAEMSIGHEFALRWLEKNSPIQPPRGNTPIDTVAFCQEIAGAVDAYAGKKREELELILRREIINALDDSEARSEVRVRAIDLLESESMTFISSKVTAGVGRPRRFPTSLRP